MSKQIYVNLPVRNLARSTAFFTALGYAFHAEFTGEKSGCVILGENIFAMLLTNEMFEGFSKKPICDTATASEVLVCLSCESRREIDELVAKAVAAGGTAPKPAQDHGMMYGHGFEDLDGHIRELMHMPEGAVCN